MPFNINQPNNKHKVAEVEGIRQRTPEKSPGGIVASLGLSQNDVQLRKEELMGNRIKVHLEKWPLCELE